LNSQEEQVPIKCSPLSEVHFTRFEWLIHFLIGKTDSFRLPAFCGDADDVSFSSPFSFSEYGSNSKAPREKPLAI
jgi:hypothetical protein